MSELEMSRAVARLFGRKAVEKADSIPTKGSELRRFKREKAVEAVREYKQGEPWEPGEREAAIDGATKGVLDGIIERLEV